MSSTFDYIVVGAGSAGCVVASRLTEDPGTTVLLLEAGVSDKDPGLQRALRIPQYFQFMQKSIADWDYNTEPVPSLANRSIYTPRGRILGGTSTFIAGLVVRGNRRNFDEWAELAGDPSWRFENVLPYFKALERNRRPNIGAMHGTDGVMTVTDIKLHPATRTFFAAARYLGYDQSDDFNDWEQEGGGSPYQMYVERGIRVNSANSYLRDEVRRRPNLTIEIEAEARRIVLDGSRRATGVEYDRGPSEGKTRQTATARREVIVCGGSINSPKLLMLSGIGPADHLRQCGIPVVCDLPGVGKNFHDHPIAGIVYSYKRKMQPPDSNAAGIEGGLLLRTGDRLTAPDLQLVFNAGVVGPPQTAPDWSQFALVWALVRPTSRGYLELRPDDPNGKPRIVPNYLSEPEEMAVMVRAFHISREVLAARAFDSLRGTELAPGPKVQSNAEIEAYIRESAGTLFHPVGTCKMGRRPEDGAVVDSQLRVFGIQGLRVVDGSIMPFITTGNTHTPITMIGEKGAAMIRQGEPAQSQSGSGIYRRSRYRVRPGALEQAISALGTYTSHVGMNEPQTRRYVVLQSSTDPNELVHLTEFADQNAFDTSQSSAAYRRFVDALRPILEGEVSTEAFTGGIVAGAGPGHVAPTDLVILVRFTVKDRRKAKRFREIIVEDLENFRRKGEPKGLLAFDAFADPNNDLVFYYSQRWVSADAQHLATQTYVNFAETNEICMPELLALSGRR